MNNAREARMMLRAHRYGVLSTLSKKFDGYPFGSIAPYLVDHDGSMIILISALAEHTKNILSNPRVSIITHDQRNPHIQTQGRVTVVGDAELEQNRDGVGTRYLRYFPEAEPYFTMHDFSFYRIRPIAIRYIGGFGRINWLDVPSYMVESCSLSGSEAEMIAHMNKDHQEALRNCCRHFYQFEAMDVAMLGIDLDGFDVRADDRVLRFGFEQPVLDAQQARKVLVKMAKTAKHSSPPV